MKRFSRTLTIFSIFFFLLVNLADAENQLKTATAKGKWNSLNSLKMVHSHLMKSGHIVRLEFKKPVTDWLEPVFYEKSVQIDFPGVFVVPSKKSFPAASSAISTVSAIQFDDKTLRVRFQINPGARGIEERFKLISQGRFIVVRFDSTESLPEVTTKVFPAKERSKNFKLMNDDQLSQFLFRASQKMKIKDKQIASKLDSKKYPKKVMEEEPRKTEIKVKRAGMGVVPLVDQIKKTTLTDSKKNKKDLKNPKKIITTKDNKGLFIKNSRPLGKSMEIIPSGMKMISMFALVLSLMFLTFFGFKKYVLKNTAFGGGNKLVNVLGTWFLGPKKNIALVEVAGEVLVLGISQENITLLSSVTSEEKVEEIRRMGGKRSNGASLNADSAETGSGKERSVASQAAGQFSSYLSKFSKPLKTKEQVVEDAKEQILQKIGKLKMAKA